MINSIKLLRWKSHDNTEIAFAKGTNVLVGPMGAGKTSVVDALSFALYGTFPALKSRKVTLEEIVMQRPEKHGDAKVEVVLETGGKKFVLERSVSQAGAKAFLMQGGKIVETGPARVNEAVERLLKTDYELFARTIYADQNNIDAFLSLASGERKRQIDELLGLDKFEKARVGAGGAANKLKAMKSEAERAVAGTDAKKLASEFGQAREEVKKIFEELEKQRKQMKETEGQAGFRKEKLEKLATRQAEHASLTNETAGLKATLASLEESISRVAVQVKSRISAEKIGEQEKKTSLELAEQVELRKKTMELAPKKEKLSAEIEAAEKRLSELSKETGGRKAGEIGAEAEQLKAKAAEAKNKERQLSERHSEIAASLALAKKALEEKSALEKLVSELEAGLNEKNASLKSLGDAGERSNKLAAVEEGERKNAAAASGLQKAIAALEASHAVCLVCESPLEHEKALQLAERKKGELEKAEGELRKAREERQALSLETAKAERLQADLQKTGEKRADEGKKLEKAAAEASKGEGIEKELEKLGGELSGAKQEILDLLKQESACSSALNAAKSHAELLKQRDALRVEEKALSQKLSQAREKYSEERIADFEALSRELEKNRELLLLEEQAGRVKQKLSEAEQKLATLGFDEKQLEQAREEMLEVEKRRSAARVACESGEKMLSEKKAREKELGERAQNLEKQLARLKKLDSSISSVAKFQNCVSESQGHLRSELVGAVNEAAGILWKSIYPYADYQAVRLDAGEEDYAVVLLASNGEWVPAEHVSGGERTCASLSLRIAFATVLTPHLSLLVLDEPTHNLDASAISSFCRTLREELPKIVEQTFIITHDEALKEGANAAVYKIERDKDRGDKSTVERLSAS